MQGDLIRLGYFRVDTREVEEVYPRLDSEKYNCTSKRGIYEVISNKERWYEICQKFHCQETRKPEVDFSKRVVLLYLHATTSCNVFLAAERIEDVTTIIMKEWIQGMLFDYDRDKQARIMAISLSNDQLEYRVKLEKEGGATYSIYPQSIKDLETAYYATSKKNREYQECLDTLNKINLDKISEKSKNEFIHAVQEEQAKAAADEEALKLQETEARKKFENEFLLSKCGPQLS